MTAATPAMVSRLEEALVISVAGRVALELAERPAADGWRRQWTWREKVGLHECGHAIAAIHYGKFVHVRILTGTSGVCFCSDSPFASDPVEFQEFVSDEEFCEVMGSPADRAAAEARAREILEAGWKKVLAVFDKLLIQGELSGTEIDELLKR